jgi:hypothetical protein
VDIPPFRLCRKEYWAWSQKYGISAEEARASARKHFELETAAAAATDARGKSPFFVQTTDEHGNDLPV